jgi:hypothetical protein
MSFTEPSGPLTIAEVAALSGLSAHTLAATSASTCWTRSREISPR